jgi:hypothetical protein
MRTIRINGKKVRIPVETMKRIERVAAQKKISTGEAVEFCLQKVI